MTLDSASDTLVIADDTIQRSGAGTTTLDLLDTSGTTGLSIVNSDAGQVANVSVEGSLSASSLSGDGAGLTGLNATNIATGTLADGLLSSNVALLDGTSNVFDNNTTFTGGLTVGNSALSTAGNIRFTGTDFEGFDGTSWVSLTSGGGGSGGAGANVIKSVDETISTAVTLQNDDELLFPVGANQTWTFDFVVQAQSGGDT